MNSKVVEGVLRNMRDNIVATKPEWIANGKRNGFAPGGCSDSVKMNGIAPVYM